MPQLRKRNESQNTDTVMLMLGLYLIVLAFFILLNSISEVNEESFEKASQSIARGFGFQTVVQERSRDIPDDEMRIFDSLSVELRQVLEAYVALDDFDFEDVRNQNQMIARFDYDAFFEEGSARIETTQAGLFNDLAEVISQKRPGMGLSLEVSVYAQDSAPQDLDLAGRRATILTRALLERGADEQQLLAEVREGDDGEIILFFNVNILNLPQASRGIESR
jgi:flagellar motor protein MotB